MLELQNNQIFNNWKIIEANIINPETKNKAYIGKPAFSKCLCTSCNKTEKYFLNYVLKNNQASSKCKNCTLIERNTKNREVQINKIYGYLQVIGDAGYKEMTDGKRRHFSLCKCLLCGNETEIMDNKLQTGNNTSCGCIGSRGETEIKILLDKNNIIYNKDVVFPELLEQTQRHLRFDFIIYNEDGSINRFVEFDGNQHITGMWGGNWSNLETFDVIQERDNIKNNFCLKNNYTLIRLPYSLLNKITLEDIFGDKYKVTEENKNE